MGQDDPDERLVYLACQHIFRGSYSHVRKPKVIRSLIQENKPSLAGILREYTIKRTSNVAKKLLEDQVFDDTLKAKIRFPELFDVSPNQSAEREVSEAEAAKVEASAVKEITEREVSRDIHIVSEAKSDDEGYRELDKFHPVRYRGINKAIPSLYPVYTQYRCQHLITTTIQQLLEESCFEFAQQHFPHLLAINGWDCAEAVELTEWTKLLSQHPPQPSDGINKPINELFGHVRELRHSAVHRLRKTANGVERLAENAQLFLETLDDVFRSEKVSVLRRELKCAIEEIKCKKDLLERRLSTQFKEIQEKRAELDMCEKDAIESMSRDDQQNQKDIGEQLEGVVRNLKSNETHDEKGKGKLSSIKLDLYESEDEFPGVDLTT
ncbi:hypothetical protein N7466_011131 [Penicillium verhagenii]|uniref:uncharacterized protein n=1 Tax=Penicillium verhagenii TaxID=1562060 RepID=UPI002545B47B|nr:uncharacterized protein N7466_011131 [Penicillium verhagenii]KAJ5917577.1 hypothetical protein N7466_011131 [Penicillium verhagenii]